METIAIENGKLATELAKALLERKGYELIGGNWEAGRDGVVALDPDGTLVFVDASMSDPRAGGSRTSASPDAASRAGPSTGSASTATTCPTGGSASTSSKSGRPLQARASRATL